MPLCECGCEGTTLGGSFLPGHDQRLRALLEEQVGGLLGLRAIVQAAHQYQLGQISENDLGRTVRAQFAANPSPPATQTSKTSCRDEILVAAKLVMKNSGLTHFSIPEVIKCMIERDTKYAESTIRTHIVSRMCANAPENHAVTYRDLMRTDRGEYQFLSSAAK